MTNPKSPVHFQLEHRLPGFWQIKDAGLESAVRTSLEKDQATQACFRELGKILQIDPGAICLVESRLVTRDGQKKIPVMDVLTTYNPSFHNEIKAQHEGRFNSTLRCWNIPLAQWDAAAQKLGLFFKGVIDLRTGVIMMHDGAIPPQEVEPIFTLRPQPLQVDPLAILQAIKQARPQDAERILPDSWVIHQGERFSRTAPRVFKTRYPFLLLRWGVQGGKPRYALYATESNTLGDMGFGQDDKKTRMLLGSYTDAFAKIQEPIMLPDSW